MRVLIVGAGGREHALLWKLRRDAPDASFFATRPNGGMAGECEAVDLSPQDGEAVAAWAAGARIDLAVVGPEAPLAGGMADRLGEAGVPAFGPSAAAARIESSKAFAKKLMARAGVPTAAFEVHDELEAAVACIESMRPPVVIKASGLAAGKGVSVCASADDGVAAARRAFDGAFGDAGKRVVIEEFLEGEEMSVFFFASGEQFVPLLPSQDHKRVGEGDRGPNTGGMGAYAPVGLATDSLLDEIGERVAAPTLAALAEAGRPFSGLLYAGLAITRDGPKVVEFNCRFGDPETQAVLPLMESSLLDPMLAVARGDGIAGHEPRFRDAAAVCTVLAARGYPGACAGGAPISVPALPGDTILFHAGTSKGAGGLETSGGRVLAATAVASSFDEARKASRAAAEAVSFDGKQFRRDIGWRESARLRRLNHGRRGGEFSEPLTQAHGETP